MHTKRTSRLLHLDRNEERTRKIYERAEQNMTLPNLHKVLYASFYWTRKGSNARRDEKPLLPTKNGTEFDPNEICTIGNGSQETLLENCNRFGGPDKWFAHLTLHFSASNTLTVTGPMAEKLWESYKGVVYNTKI